MSSLHLWRRPQRDFVILVLLMIYLLRIIILLSSYCQRVGSTQHPEYSRTGQYFNKKLFFYICVHIWSLYVSKGVDVSERDDS
jgi:hypothetical protein